MRLSALRLGRVQRGGHRLCPGHRLAGPSPAGGKLCRLDVHLSMGKPARPRCAVFRPSVHASVLPRLDRLSRHPGRIHAREGQRLFREHPEHDRHASRILRPQSARLRGVRPQFLGHHGGRRAGRSGDAAGSPRPALLRLHVARGAVRSGRWHDCPLGDAVHVAFQRRGGALGNPAPPRDLSRRSARTTAFRAASIRRCGRGAPAGCPKDVTASIRDCW